MIFLQIDKESKSGKKMGLGGGTEEGNCGVVGYWMYMNKCFKWHFYSSRRTPVPNYSETHAYM